MGEDDRGQRDEEMALSLLCPLNLKGTSKYQRPDGKRGTDKKTCVCMQALIVIFLAPIICGVLHNHDKRT